MDPEEVLHQQLLFVKNSLESIREYDLSSAVAFLRRLAASGLLKPTEEVVPPQSLQRRSARNFATVRFRATVHFKRPATALDHVELTRSPRGSLQPILWVNFTGIAGIQGPLPLIYTERIFRNLRAHDSAAAAFLDIFNHRIIQLSYTSQRWLPGFAPIRPEESPLGLMIQGMNGLEPVRGFGACPRSPTGEHLPERSRAQETLTRVILTYKTLFWKKIRSSAALQQALSHFFGVRVEIRPLRGTFLKLDTPTRLGPLRGQCCTLGHDTLLGDRLWKQGHGIDIILHDLSPALYKTFNKHAEGMNEEIFKRICKHFLPMTLSMRFFIGIKGTLRNPLRLGGRHHLGFDTWLGLVPQEGQVVEL